MKQQIIKVLNNFISWGARNGKFIIIWILLIALFSLFELKISKILSKYIFIGKEEINSRNFHFLFKACCILIIGLFSWMGIKNYRISKSLNFWLFFSPIAYLILRSNSSDELIFLSVSSKPELRFLKYSDILLLLGGLTLMLYFRNHFKDFKFYDLFKVNINRLLYLKTSDKKSLYKEDLPMDGSIVTDNDKIATTIKNKINSLYPNKAFVIGINGEWGNGKTTLLKRLDYKFKFDTSIENKSPIIFWFNAWQHQDEKSIINNFFNQLKKELSHYSGDAKTSINNYLSKLLAIVDNKYSKSFNFFSGEILNSNVTVKDHYRNINNLISRVDRKIIVFVDDLDRLNKVEIIEVIRILRNVANFHNTVFICGFDKNYVINTGEFANNFLDKIFNLEVNLPKIDQNGLLIFLSELINESTSINEKRKVNDAFSSIFDTDTDTSLFNLSVDDLILDDDEQVKPTAPEYDSIPLSPSLFFETRRDVKRFYNCLVTDLAILGSIKDVELVDYLMFKLLTFKYSWIYKYFDNKRINLWLGNSSNLKIDANNLDFLNHRKELEFIDRSTIFTVLKSLFPITLIDSNEEEYLKINQRRYLPLYLNNNVFNTSFSYTELISAHEKSSILQLINQKVIGQENEEYLLNDIKSFILKEENLTDISDYEQAVILLKGQLVYKASDFELIRFINHGEQFENFENFADSKIFSDIEDVFGNFLRALNIHYSRIPKLTSMNNNELENFLSRSGKTELTVIDARYVKMKIIQLLENYLKTTRKIKDAISILFDCTEYYFSYFRISLFYDEANKLFQEFLEENFKDFFLKKTPEEFINIFEPIYIATIFTTPEAKAQIISDANKLIEQNNHWSSDDLAKVEFLTAGWENFLDWLKRTYENLNLSDNEIQTLKIFYAYIDIYVLQNFSKPRDQDVIEHEIFNLDNGKK